MNDEKVIFNVCMTMQQLDDIRVVLVIDVLDNDVVVEYIPIEERLGFKALAIVIMIFQSDGIKKYDKLVSVLHNRGPYMYFPINLDLDLKNGTTPPSNPSIEEPQVLELNSVLYNLLYAFLGEKITYW